MYTFEPKIYVACLAAYNNGILHGKWIDADQSVDEINAEIFTMLKASPERGAYEWSIHDYEGFGEINLSENEDIETIVQIVAFIKEHEEAGMAILEYNGCDLEEAKNSMQEYCGVYKSEEDFAYELMNDCYTIPDYLTCYINYETFARDLFSGDYFSVEKDYQLHIFRHY